MSEDDMIADMAAAIRKASDDRESWLAIARAALDVVRERETADWMKAEDVPDAMEGMLAWEWSPNFQAVRLSRIPRGYSRDPHHCAGVWFMLASLPPPPEGE